MIQNPTIHKRLVRLALAGYTFGELQSSAEAYRSINPGERGSMWRDHYRATLRAMCYPPAVVRSCVYRNHAPTVVETKAAKAVFDARP